MKMYRLYPKNTPTQKLEITEIQPRESQNYTEKLQIPRKDCIAFGCWEECRKGFNFWWRSKTMAEL